MNTHAPQLPRDLMAGGSSVAIIARPIAPGVLAHKPTSQTREITTGIHRGRHETYYIAACATPPDTDHDDQGDEPDEAYQVSAAWADHLGANACTEPACFPHAN